MIDHLEEGLVALFRSTPAITRFLGDRMFPGVAPKGVTDYLVYRNLSEDKRYYLGGKSDGTPRYEYDLEVWSQDPDIARDAAAAVVDTINAVGRDWVGGAFCKRIKAKHTGQGEEPEDDQNDTWWYVRRLRIEADVHQLIP